MPAENKFFRFNNPILWGVLATAFVIAFGVILGILQSCESIANGAQECSPKWRVFLASKPNEVGDTLAGFAGALAFVWLIATVWLQGQELAAQREELSDQRKATQDMAKALEAQAEIEQKRLTREERKSFDAVFEERLIRLGESFFGFEDHEHTWTIAEDRSTARKEEMIRLIAGPSGKSSGYGYILEEIDTYFHRVKSILAASNGKGFKTKPFLEPRFSELLAAVESVLEANDQGTLACREKAKTMRLKEFSSSLQGIMRNEKLWHQRFSTDTTK
ncbi:hypothetical protein [Sulfitobacter sp. M368]|uniref:hypothetical protein n=1 Tax=Sulfitobacter sp. M368 TaxID=2867021 RepID=UPI0021A707A4|nr:hypothetical protein [Sulfitobacter sp. M368]UWR15665.1 hypothetical protein K3754_01820 [Sulfitobacter sp. M368]